jgi:hypothetical protein
VSTADQFARLPVSLHTEANWNEITKVVETKRLFLFYKSPTMAHLIPKACFEDDTQIKALRSLIASQKGLKHKLKKA